MAGNHNDDQSDEDDGGDGEEHRCGILRLFYEKGVASRFWDFVMPLFEMGKIFPNLRKRNCLNYIMTKIPRVLHYFQVPTD